MVPGGFHQTLSWMSWVYFFLHVITASINCLTRKQTALCNLPVPCSQSVVLREISSLWAHLQHELLPKREPQEGSSWINTMLLLILTTIWRDRKRQRMPPFGEDWEEEVWGSGVKWWPLYHQTTSIGNMTNYKEIIEIEITKDKDYLLQSSGCFRVTEKGKGRQQL